MLASMRLRSSISICLLLVACDGGPELDAGTDAASGADAGRDAGPADAGRPDTGPADSGPPDVGPPDAEPTDGGPPSVTDLGMAVEMDLGSADEALDAIPGAMRVDGAFLQAELAASGIDALIGETGIMTLALSDETVRALADLRQANLLLVLLTDARDALSDASEPDVITLRDRLTTLIGSLTAYRDGLARLYRERLAAGIPGAPVVVDPFFANTFVRTTGAPSRLAFEVEGRSSAMESAALEAFCFASDPVEVTVVREDTGEVIATDSGAGAVSMAVPVPFDTPTAVTVTVTTTPSSGVWEACSVSMTSRRSLRAEPFAWDPEGAAYQMADAVWSSAIATTGTAHQDAVTAGVVPATVLAAVVDQITMILDLLGPFTASDALEVPLETFQGASRRMSYVAAMFDAMVASPELAGPDASALRAELAGLKTAAEGLLAAASP